MEETSLKSEKKFSDHISSFFKKVWISLHNQTFLYILKRILSSIFTLLLIVAVVTALIRILPDTKFYDVKQYNTIKGKSGVTLANLWRNRELYKYGIVDINGKRISVIGSIFQYIYWLLPIPKKIPIKWDSTYTNVLEYWSGLVYFGKSISKSTYVLDMFTSRIGISFRISIISTLLTYLFSIPLGIAMAKKPGGIVDKIGNVFVVLNYAIPALVFYLLMNSICGNKNGIFGWGNFGFFYEEGQWQTLVPPIFCLVFLSIPGVIIWVRRFMIDELSSDYVKFARSKGLSENRIMYTHVFRNACVPLVRNLPATFLGAIVGSYYVEVIWNIPGTGYLLINALQGASPDIPVIQGLTVIYAGISMISFLLGDIITVFFDPRIRIAN